MLNICLLLIQIFAISWVTMLCLMVGKEAVNAWLTVVALALNLMILKQVNLFGLDVTCTKAMGVSYILGLNLMQEYYGRRSAQVHVLIAALCTFGFVMLEQLHMLFVPNVFDTTQIHYSAIFTAMPLITSLSFITFIVVQLVDIRFFSYLRDRMGKKNFTGRVVISLMLAQTLDTVIFYPIMGMLDNTWNNVWHIMGFTLLIKFVIIFLVAPYTSIAHHFVKKDVILIRHKELEIS